MVQQHAVQPGQSQLPALAPRRPNGQGVVVLWLLIAFLELGRVSILLCMGWLAYSDAQSLYIDFTGKRRRARIHMVNIMLATLTWDILPNIYVPSSSPFCVCVCHSFVFYSSNRLRFVRTTCCSAKTSTAAECPKTSQLVSTTSLCTAYRSTYLLQTRATHAACTLPQSSVCTQFKSCFSCTTRTRT